MNPAPITNDCLTAPAPLPVVDHEVRARLGSRHIFLVVACAALSMLLLNVFHRESYTGDEGFYGVTALNMLRSPEYLLRPSYYPAGDFVAEKDAFAHPPFNSYFYALSLWFSRGSLVGPEVLNMLAFVSLLYFAYRIVGLFDLQAARFTILLLAASPAILVSYSMLEAEPLMTSFGIISLYCALRAGFTWGKRLWLFVAGLCLGLSFALKLWLCGPLGLAVGVALFIRARQPGLRWTQKLAALLLFGIGAVIPSALHLLSVWMLYPDDLAFWLRNIYFGIFTSLGISGAKLAGAGVPADWMHPFWYYAAALYRDHFFLLPVILLGLGPAFRDDRSKRELLWIVLAGAAGVLPLSLMKVKEPLYVLSCAVFLYLLAGLCLAALLRRIASGTKIDSLSARLGSLGILGLLVLFPLAYARGIQPGKITGTFVLAHSIILALFLAALLWSQRKSTTALFEWTVYGACVAAIITATCFNFVTRSPRDKIITHITEPYIQNNSPQVLSVIASNFKSYQFYSFRRGCYWEEVALEKGPDAVLATPEFSHVRAFIIDPEDLQKQEIAPWLRWLETHASEKTRDVDAQLHSVSGFRFFIRDTATAATR